MSIQQLLQGVMSPDNVVRKAAEAAFLQALSSGQTDALPLGFLQELLTSPEAGLRQMAAVMLRKTVLYEPAGEKTDNSANAHWHKMSDDAKKAVATQLLQAMQRETADSVRRPLTHTLSEVAGMVMGDGTNSWPELWATMHACATGPSQAAQESALTLFEHLAPYAVYGLKAHKDMFGAIFKARLTDATAPARVRVAAAKAAAAQIISADTADEAALYADTLPHMLQALQGVAGLEGEEEAARDISGVLTEVATAHATVFRKVLSDALRLLCGVAGAPSADPQARKLCLETVVSIAEGAPGMARKLPGDGYLAAVLPVAMRMLLEHGEEGPEDAEWEGLSSGEDHFGLGPAADADDCFLPAAEDALNRVGAAIGAKRALTPLAALVREFLGSAHAGLAGWKHRYAGLCAIGTTSALVDGGNEALLRSIAGQVAPLATGDPSPRVRWNAAYVLGLFAASQQGFSLAAHSIVAPALIACLKDPSVRVRGQAAGSAMAFTDALQGDIDEEALAPYLQGLLEGLFGLLGLPATGRMGERDRHARETAITAISALAQAAQGLVRPYYGVIMPGLQGLLSVPDAPPSSPTAASGSGKNDESAAQSRHVRLMKGKALECLSVLGLAVGREQFRPDALGAMGGIVGMIQTYAAEKRAADASGGGKAGSGGGDDPVSMYMWAAVSRIASALGPADFAPFLPHVMPPLLESVCSETKTSVVTVSDADAGVGSGLGDDDLPGGGGGDSDADSDDDDDGFVDVDHIGGAVVRVRTADLEDKLSCASCLSSLLEELRGQLVAPYVPQVVDGLIRLLRVSGPAFSDLRATAAGALSQALASAASTLSAAEVAAAAEAMGGAGGPGAPPAGPAGSFLAMLSASLDELQNVLKDDREDDADALKAILAAVADVLTAGCKVAHFAPGSAPPQRASPTPASSGNKAGGVDYVRLVSGDMLRRVTAALLRVHQAAVQRRAVRKAEATVNAEDMDEEAAEEAGNRDREDEGIMFGAIDGLGALAKTHGPAFLPSYTELVAGRVRDMAHPACVPVDRQHAAFLICDVLEFIGGAAACPPTSESPSGHYASEYLPVLIAGTRDTHEGVRQASAYGLGAAAENLPPALFGPFLGQVLYALSQLVARPPTGKRGTPEDNGVTALGKLILHQYTPAPPGAPAPRSEIVAGFLKHLPLAHDEAEARVAAHMLCGWVEGSDPDVLAVGASGPDPTRLGELLRVLGDACARSAVRDEDLALRVGRLLSRMQSTLPPATLGAVWGGLSQAHRDALTAAGNAAAAAAAAGGAGAGARPR